MKKIMMAVAMMGAAAAFVPQPAAAEPDCTQGYVKCLNDSHNLRGVLQRMADIECAAEYAACIAKAFV